MIILNIWKNKIHVPNHQPVYIFIKKQNNGNKYTKFWEIQESCWLERFFLPSPSRIGHFCWADKRDAKKRHQQNKTKQRTLMIEYSYRKWISIDIYG